MMLFAAGKERTPMSYFGENGGRIVFEYNPRSNLVCIICYRE